MNGKQAKTLRKISGFDKSQTNYQVANNSERTEVIRDVLGQIVGTYKTYTIINTDATKVMYKKLKKHMTKTGEIDIALVVAPK